MQRLALLGTAVFLACAGYASAQSKNLDIYGSAKRTRLVERRRASEPAEISRHSWE